MSPRTTPSAWTNNLTVFHESTAGPHHPIDRASRQLALTQLACLRSHAPVILEIGCSSGYFLHDLQRHFPQAVIIGADYVAEPLARLAHTLRGVHLVQLDLTHCPLANCTIDVVVMLNVLEHIADDALALQHVYRILKPGGIAILEVPAGPHLYDIYDEILGHHRRYTLAGLSSLVTSTGFEIITASHLGALIYPAFCCAKIWNKRYMRRNMATKWRCVADNIRATRSSRLAQLLFNLELWLGHRVRWPVGVRCVITARKPTSPSVSM